MENQELDKRACKKCGKHVPRRITIEGVQHNLQSRKFCLDCSPYGGHNTKSDDPSRENERKKPYAEWSEGYKENHNLICRTNQYRRALTLKQELVDKAGGKCQKCGYSRCIDALIFHHRDPLTKSFGLALNNLWSHSREKILEEYDKCDLYCQNCHIEHHRDEKDQDENTIRHRTLKNIKEQNELDKP